MLFKRLLLLVAYIAAYGFSYAQSVFMPLNHPAVYSLQRLEIKQGKLADPSHFNTSSGFYRRQFITQYIDSFETGGVKLSKQDFFNMEYIRNDNFEWTHAYTTQSNKKSWGEIFHYKSTFYAVNTPDFKLAVNPVVNLFAASESNNNNPVIINTRGIEMRASIGNNIGIFTRLEDDIMSPNQRTLDFYKEKKVLPGESFLKTSDGKTFNYSRARGYINFNINKYIDMQFGHDNNVIGNGYRTFYMSDFSRPQLFLRTNTHVWKLNYTNIYGSMYRYSPMSNRSGSFNIERHYFATQYLNLQATKNLQFGLFQTISFHSDSIRTRNGFDIEYLNPIIFYKSVENGLNSPDKAILGADFKWNFLRQFQVYGQMVISEMVLAEFIQFNGWAGNKYAIQLGTKCLDIFGVNNLDVQLEYNYVRPYMYTSFDAGNAYVNYNQNMAHPLGANFMEGIGIIRYQPIERLMLKATGMYYIIGRDTGNTNYGSNIGLSYKNIIQTYGNYVGQGIRNDVLLLDLVSSYMLYHNFFIDFQIAYRGSQSELAKFESNSFFIGMGIRWNMVERRWDF
jgi:hypothetical protein